MNLTDWINNTLYPTLFESIDSVFREHSFNKYRGNWRSSTYLMNGERHERKDKTVVTKKHPSRIYEQGGESYTLIDYVMKRDGYTEPIEAIKWLASSVGLELPNSSNFDAGAYQEQKERLELLEECNNFFIESLTIDPNAKETLSYLESRGYSREDIKFMELGYIPSQMALHKHLETKGYSKTLIEEALHLHKDIGVVNKLSIPFRSGNSIKGFIFRSLDKEQKNKYINSTGLKRGDNLFNLSSLKGDKDITVVEGYLDALIATARGVDNVVALGGASISPSGIQDAIRKGVKSFTLCLDNDAGGTTGTKQTVEALLREGVNRIYVVALPTGEAKIDPDDVIREEGVERFKEILSTAIPYYLHNLNNIFTRYANIEKVEKRELTFKEIDKLLEEVVEGSVDIVEPIDKERYKASFLQQNFTKALGITEESLEATLDKINFNKDREEQRRELTTTLSKATSLQQKGELEEALQLLEEGVKETKAKDRKTEFSKYLIPSTKEELVEAFKDEKESIDTGYTIGGEPLLLPSGALSFIVAPTSHGKTTALINLALGVVEKNLEEKNNSSVYFFSYEEHEKDIRANFLNSYIGRNYSHTIGENCRRSIKHYLKTGSRDMFKKGKRDVTGELVVDYREDFLKLEKEYFKELEETGKINVNYSNYTALELVELIRYLHKNTNVGAIFIDYIQLLRLGSTKFSTYSRQEEVKEVCIALKDIAVETGLSIVLAGQFNRKVQNPLQLHLNQIGEAGDIERVANLILAIWNNKFKVVGDKDEIKRIEEENLVRENTLFVEVLKNRAGEVGLTDWLDWNGNTATIKNIDRGDLDKDEYLKGGRIIEDAGSSTNEYKKNNINFSRNNSLPFTPNK